MVAAHFIYYNFSNANFEKFLIITMWSHIKVAELDTLSDGKGITGIINSADFFNETFIIRFKHNLKHF